MTRAVYVRRHVRRERAPRLTPAQKLKAKKLLVAYAEAPSPFGPLTPPTLENISLMPVFGKYEVPSEAGFTIPVPQQHPTGSFVDFEKQDAELLAQELRKLKGQPVILTGGGGGGAQTMILQDSKIVAFPPCLKGPDGHCLDNRDNVGPGADVWYVPDPAARPEQIHYRVRVLLDNPFAQKGSIMRRDEPTFDPFIGSWRITALHGYGAEKLRQEYPPGWE